MELLYYKKTMLYLYGFENKTVRMTILKLMGFYTIQLYFSMIKETVTDFIDRQIEHFLLVSNFH